MQSFKEEKNIKEHTSSTEKQKEKNLQKIELKDNIQKVQELIEAARVAEEKELHIDIDIKPKDFAHLMDIDKKSSSNPVLDLSNKTFIENLKILLFSSNTNLRKIDTNTFPKIKNLETLGIDGSNVVYLASNAFANFKNIKTLNLTNGLIREIAPDAFNGLTNLKELVLKNNKLESNKLHIPVDLKNVEYLDLSGNSMNNIDPEMFKNLPNVKILDLSDNNIEFLKPDTFKHLKNLEILRLGRNKIKVLNKGAFNGLQNLKRLILRSNLLEEIELGALDTLNQLEYLILDKNKIRNLEDIIKNLKNLEKLVLSHNLIPSIQPDIAKQLSTLKSLDISGNPKMALSLETIDLLKKTIKNFYLGSKYHVTPDGSDIKIDPSENKQINSNKQWLGSEINNMDKAFNSTYKEHINQVNLANMKTVNPNSGKTNLTKKTNPNSGQTKIATNERERGKDITL